MMEVGKERRVGFTGTRKGMTHEQRKALVSVLKAVRATHLHHGGCVGADATAHKIAINLGLKIEVHPPEKSSRWTNYAGATVIHPPKPYLERNHDIVNATRVLVATPKTDVEELRSGTWATIRYASKQIERSVVIIKPNGSW